MQIAKSFGAEVTGVCSTRNLEILRSLGADHIVDYTKEDVTQDRECYDLILAVNGSNSISAYKRILKPNGIIVYVGGKESQLLSALFLGAFFSTTGSKKISTLFQRASQKDLNYVKELLATGKVKPIIDKQYKLS